MNIPEVRAHVIGVESAQVPRYLRTIQEDTDICWMISTLKCGICCGILQNTVLLGCSHPFCKSCIVSSRMEGGRPWCPTCGIPIEEMIPSYVINTLLELMFLMTKDDYLPADYLDVPFKQGIGYLRDQVTCRLCKKLFVKPRTANCSHTFCGMCVECEEFPVGHARCPICKKAVNRTWETPMLEDFITEAFWHLRQNKKRRPVQVRPHNRCNRIHLDGSEGQLDPTEPDLPISILT